MKSGRRAKTGNITIVFNSDDGVDDALAQLLILAEQEVSKNIVVAGMVPTVGNAILGQTEINVRRILALTGRNDIPVYPGALTPLGLEKNVSEVDAAINATHFYGHDGLSDLPPQSWPPITIPLQKKNGYEFIAELVLNATADNPVTLMSTAALTEIYKSLCKLEKLSEKLKLPPRSFADKLVIVAMGGIIDLNNGPNAPFDRPDYNNKTCIPKNPPCKDAEANFYWDTPATQGVFKLCAKYGIKIQLVTLDLTQNPALYWTKAQVAGLRAIQNYVASQIANMTDVVPWIDAKHFPKGKFPWHDGLTAAWILWGEELFYKILAAIVIGSHGETLKNNDPHAIPNVEIIAIRPDKAAECMKRVVAMFNNFGKNSKTISPLPLIHHPTSSAAHLEIPQFYRSIGKISREINHLFFEKTKSKFRKGSVVVNTPEPPCFYPNDGASNIISQSGEQPEYAAIKKCELPKNNYAEQYRSPGFVEGFKDGLVHTATARFFRSLPLDKTVTEKATEGMIAASISSVSLPAGLLYIILNNLPGEQFNQREKELIAGFVFIAFVFSNPWDAIIATMMHIMGYQLANRFVDTAADVITKKHYICAATNQLNITNEKELNLGARRN